MKGAGVNALEETFPSFKMFDEGRISALPQSLIHTIKDKMARGFARFGVTEGTSRNDNIVTS